MYCLLDIVKTKGIIFQHVHLYSMNLNLILMELYLSAYQCYRMRQYQTPRKLIEEIDSLEEPTPYCPPSKLLMRVHKHAPEIKVESKQGDAPSNTTVASIVSFPQVATTQSNVKLKFTPAQSLHVQFLQQPGLKGQFLLFSIVELFQL